MRLRKIDILAALALVLTLVGAASAGPITVYDEAVTGDLSGIFNAPTALIFQRGENEVKGTTGAGSVGSNGTIQDYFNFTIPALSMLTSITLVSSNLPEGGHIAFIGLHSGPVFNYNFSAYANGSPLQGIATADLLGWAHFTTASNGTDILPLIRSGLGAGGFASAPGGGPFAVWIQDTSPGMSTYDMVFNVQAVPEPGTVLLTLTGLAVLAGVRRRRR